MRVFRDADVPWRPADSTSFTASAETKRLGEDSTGTPVTVYHVTFGESGRTHWHTHSGPQWLLVVEGRIRVQRWGEPAQDVQRGDAVVIAAGEKHWHGSVPGSSGAHLAVNVDARTTWLEAVTDEQYRAVNG